MTGVALIPWLQGLAGLLWLAEAIILFPGTWRAARGRGDALDAGRVPVFFVALIQFGFTARWWLWPHAIGTMVAAELVAWGTLYLLSAAVAAFCIAAHRAVGRSLR